jgi:hypothetical protein
MKFLIFLLLMSCQQPDYDRRTPPPAPPPVVKPDPPDPVPPVPPRPTRVSFEQFETGVLTDLTRLVSAEQENARYITVCDQMNAGNFTQDMQQGVQKTLNQISLENDVEPGVWVGASGCTLRIDLRDYGLTPHKWRLIENDDPLKFESLTDQGRLIQQLTQARRPWILGSNFAETALIRTYYDLVEIPVDLNQFLAGIGCNLQADFDDFSQDLYLSGVRRSLIALQKNRIVLMTDCRDGPMTSTYDFILEDVTSAERSLSINPFPIEARSFATAQEDAQEFIYTLPNGLFGYALFANGLREDFAPTNIVVDNIRADLDPTIRNARSCSSCHAVGLLPVEDYIAEHVRGNPAFVADDIQKAQAYFGRNAAMQAAMRAANNDFARALGSIGIRQRNGDPINELTDNIRREMTISQVAGMLFMTEAEFRRELPGSPVGLLEIGQLLNGGTINFQDFVKVKDVLIEDLNLFQEDLGQ